MTSTIRNLLMAFTLILIAPLALAGGMYGSSHDQDKSGQGSKDNSVSNMLMKQDKDSKDKPMSDKVTKESELD